MRRAPATLYGPWDYASAKTPFPYDDTPTYQIAADFLNGHGLIEDWGAGVGWMKQFVDGEYRAIDGAWSTWVDRLVDLRAYRSDVPCAFMRHVLEHNADWRIIAENFTSSWHVRAALVLFIPPQPDEDVNLGGPDWPVPDIGICGPDLMELMARHGTQIEFQELLYPPEHSVQWSWEGLLLMQR